MKYLKFILIEDLFDYNFGNTPPPPLYNVPTRGGVLFMNNFQEQLQNIKNQEHKSFVTRLNHINYNRLSAYFLPFLYKKDSIKELDKDKLGKLVDLNGLVTVRKVARNFGEMPQMSTFSYKKKFINRTNEI